MNNLHLQDGKVAFRWSRWRNKKRQEVSYCLMVLFSGAVLLGAGGLAVAGPTGGQVTGGTGTISQSGTTTTVDQTSNVLQINWQTFSTAPNETVNFDQPNANAVAINRVVGGVPSYLQGALNANGRVYILNSAGVTFTGTSRVNVGALLATTAMSIDGDVSGLASFSAPAGSGGSVINQGSITVSNGGFAILAAPYVQNTGFIQANLGTVALAGTNSFTLDLRGDGLINFVVPAGTAQEIVKDGQKVGVDNAGTIRAQSGQVIISANVASQVVNAVVNMSGIVDADAFAANASGGTVMVTSAGDINLSGTVTAQGNGTGAGGQIVTKAVGADNVEAGAVLNAAGAPGEGGQIEVSGRDVLLGGSINPGSGGMLFIDPLNFTIKNGTSGQTANAIGEHKLEALLQNGVGFAVHASNQILMQDLTDNTLQGGKGNLTLKADNDIAFQGTNDRIVTGAGDILMSAGAGGIGIQGGAGHTVSFVSGGAGVTQAGDIVLISTGSIDVKSVTVKSSGNSTFNALFSANAGHNFSAAGLIDVEARAVGANGQVANADIRISAGNDITLHGLKDIATASELGGVQNVHANAFVTLHAANQINDLAGEIVSAQVGGHSGAFYEANALYSASGAAVVSIAGALDVTAKANDFDVNTAEALARAFIKNVGDLTLDSLVVEASAEGQPLINGLGVDFAGALASIHAAGSVHITHNAIVEANAIAPKGSFALAEASLSIDAAVISIANHAIVEALGQDSPSGNEARATANLLLTATGGDVTVGDILVDGSALNAGNENGAEAAAHLAVNAAGSIDVSGDVTVQANAHVGPLRFADASSPAASASVTMEALKNLFIGGDFEAVASASSVFALAPVSAKARAHLSGNSTLTVRGAVNVLANAAGRDGVSASASFSAHARDSVQIGSLDVQATAEDFGAGEAVAKANAFLDASASEVGGFLAIDGNAAVLANAQDPVGSLASAQAHFRLSGSSVEVDAVILQLVLPSNSGIKVAAVAAGAGEARASATLDVQAAFAVAVGGDVVVSADASGGSTAVANAFAHIATHSGSGALSFNGVEISGRVDVVARAEGDSSVLANASLSIDARETRASMDSVLVSASADNFGFGRAQATANAAITARNSVDISGDASVLAQARTPTGSTAAANAELFVLAANIHVGTFDSEFGNVTVSAIADNSGFGGAQAIAGAVLETSVPDGNIHVDGNITVVASADDPHGTSAFASATLFIDAAGNVIIGHGSEGPISGNIDVEANAIDGGTSVGRAEAVACASIFGSSIDIKGDVFERARASDAGFGSVDGGASASARAALLLSAGRISIEHDGTGTDNIPAVAVLAEANGFDAARSAFASAVADIEAHGSNGRIEVDGAVVDQAIASEAFGNFASANAHLLIDGRTVSIGNDLLHFGTPESLSTSNVGVFVGAFAFNGGPGKVVADAAGTLLASDVIGLVTVQGPVGVVAVAQGTDSSVDEASAHAHLNVEAAGVSLGQGTSAGGAFVTALANDGTGPAVASARADITATEGDVLIDGTFSVFASATNHGGGGAVANAFAHITATDLGSGTINITQGANVIAIALNDGGLDPAIAAQANAQLDFSSASQVTVNDHLTVVASANNFGPGGVRAEGAVNFDGASTVTLGDVTLFVAALNRSPLGTGGAVANAFFAPNSVDDLTLTRLDVEAHASSAGGHGALANAFASLRAISNNIVIPDGVTVIATALNGTATGSIAANASAQAAFILTGATNAIQIGDLTLEADATNYEAGTVNAHILASLDPASLDLGFVTLKVNALNLGSHGTGGASASINFLASAGLNVHITGLDIEARAASAGGHGAVANAFANIHASGESINIDSSVTVIATALNGKSGNAGNGDAGANAQFIVGNASNIAIGDLTIQADATNYDTGTVHANGSAHFDPQSLSLGDVTIKVAARNLGAGGFGGARASAIFDPSNFIHVQVKGLDIEASATSSGGDGAFANAVGHVTSHANILSILGDVKVTALAVNGAGAGNAIALADLDLEAGPSALQVHGSMDVSANADNAGNGIAEALANATLAAGVGSVGVASGILVEAIAHDAAGPSALADAILNVTGDEVSIGSRLIHFHFSSDQHTSSAQVGVFVGAIAVDDKATGKAIAKASGNIHATNDGDAVGPVTINGAAIFSAFASDLNGPSGNAQALVSIIGNDISLNGGTEDIDGPKERTVGLEIRAVANDAEGQAFAEASGNLFATDSLSITGVASVSAQAFNAGGDAAATALAFLHLTDTGGGVTVTGPLSVEAHADNEGPGKALASALADLEATGSIDLESGAAVIATAFSRFGTSDGLAASANAHLDFSGAQTVTVANHLVVAALATNLGDGSVQAHGVVDFGSAGATGTLDLGDVIIDVSALNLSEEGTGTGGANAFANFTVGSGVSLSLQSLNLQAVAESHGGSGAQATAVGNIVQTGALEIFGGVTVNAFASNAGTNGNAIAHADLTLRSLNGGVLGSGVQVTALAVENQGLIFDQGQVHNFLVSGKGNASASANLSISADGVVDLGQLTVQACAFGGGSGESALGSVVAKSVAKLRGTNIEVGFAEVDARATAVDASNVTALASLNASAQGSLTVFGGVHVSAFASAGDPVNVTATADAILQAGADLAIPFGNIDVEATASTHGLGADLVRANAQLLAIANGFLDVGTPFFTFDGDLLGGNVTVSAHEHADGAAQGTASAQANLQAFAGEGNSGGLVVFGNITVSADAYGGSGARNVEAFATLIADAAGLESIGGNIAVKANAVNFAGTADGIVLVLAEARAMLDANAIQIGGFSSGVLAGGDVNVDASAIGHNQVQDAGAVAVFQATADGSAGSLGGGNLIISGKLGVDANAFDPGTDRAFAHAQASLDAQHGSVAVSGDIAIRADLAGNGLTFGFSTGSVLGLDSGEYMGGAVASLDVRAGGNASVHAVSLQAVADLTNAGSATSVDGDGRPIALASACGYFLVGSNLTIAGSLDVDAHLTMAAQGADGSAIAQLWAFASDNLTLAKPLSMSASALVEASGDPGAFASANGQLLAFSGDITLPRAVVFANASAPHGTDASASAKLHLDAGHDVDITHGLFVQGSAFAPSAEGVNALGSMLIEAGHDVFVQGDLTAIGVALGSASDQAQAFIDVEAGLRGSGNIQMLLTNMEALAFADPHDDHATAGITLNAQNNILVVGNDPIADAFAGSVGAFLQTHFTRDLIHSGASGGVAHAFIHIHAGGTVTFIPLKSTNDLALLGLPDHYQPTSSGSLSQIELLINGADCGVFGAAGMGPDKKAEACDKAAFNIEGQDVLP